MGERTDGRRGAQMGERKDGRSGTKSGERTDGRSGATIANFKRFPYESFMQVAYKLTGLRAYVFTGAYGLTGLRATGLRVYGPIRTHVPSGGDGV